jgi:hypothetical protein
MTEISEKDLNDLLVHLNELSLTLGTIQHFLNKHERMLKELNKAIMLITPKENNETLWPNWPLALT